MSLGAYNMHRRYLSRLAATLHIPVSEQGKGRKVPRTNDALRVAIHDACLGPGWGPSTDGKNAVQMDQMLARMVKSMEMENGYALAVAQACIRAGKQEHHMARSNTAYLRDAKGGLVIRPMTHEHRMARFKAAEEFYAEARRYQQLYEEGRCSTQ